jgi:hypothetical protein
VVTRRIVVLAALLAAVLSCNAYAQEDNRFAVGISYAQRGDKGHNTHGGRGPGIEWRWGHSKEGWGWQYAFNWYSLGVNRSIGGSETELGEMHLRPLMGGYGYTHLMGRMALTFDAVAGVTYNTFDVSGQARDAYRDRMGVQSVDVRRSFAPIVKPEVSMWYDINRKIGLTADAGYIFARPRLTVSTPLGDDVQRFRADAVSVTVGIVYRIF